MTCRDSPDHSGSAGRFPSRRRHPASFAAALAAVILLGGCSNNGGAGTDPTAKDDMTPTEQLLARPTAEEAATMYKDQLIRVRAALKELAPDIAWSTQTPGDDGESACQDPFGQVDGSTTFGFATGGGGAIPDDDWEQAVQITRRVLEPDGYDRVTITVDKPGQHQVSFTGRYGAVLTIGSERSTDLSVAGGCFLSPEAHAAASKTQ